MPPVIHLSGVSKSFETDGRTVEAVCGIDLDVPAGEIVTLVGPSGCGKSTLLNLTAGLFPPSTGVVEYAGSTVPGLNRRTGYMTQSDHLLPWRTVAGNVAAPLEIARRRRSEIEDRTAYLL